MARMYSRAKGRSGSKRVVADKAPAWVRYKPKEVEMLIIKLAKEGNTPSKIGAILRDTYGIPSTRQLLNKKIQQVLAEKNLLTKLPEDLTALLKQLVKLQTHMQNNKKDMTAKRGYIITESKIRRLIKYYKAKGKIPQEWNYNPQEAGFYIQ